MHLTYKHTCKRYPRLRSARFPWQLSWQCWERPRQLFALLSGSPAARHCPPLAAQASARSGASQATRNFALLLLLLGALWHNDWSRERSERCTVWHIDWSSEQRAEQTAIYHSTWDESVLCGTMIGRESGASRGYLYNFGGICVCPSINVCCQFCGSTVSFSID